MGMSGGFGWLGGLLGLLFFAGFAFVLVVGLVWLWRRGQGHAATHNARTELSSSPALDILSERYARGEITREEYLAMRKDLA